MTLLELWRKEYQLSDGRCALCENRGLLQCHNGTKRYCLCPNGRDMRRKVGPMSTERKGATVYSPKVIDDAPLRITLADGALESEQK